MLVVVLLEGVLGAIVGETVVDEVLETEEDFVVSVGVVAEEGATEVVLILLQRNSPTVPNLFGQQETGNSSLLIKCFQSSGL